MVIGVKTLFAQVYPVNFSQVQVATGISSPTVMAFAPDGRIFVAQQNGALRIIKNNVLLATPAIDIDVDASGERGLIGIALHPSFASNNFVYLYYTTVTGTKRNRISRFTFNGDLISPSSEVIILELDPLSTATNHNGGAMSFGIDGKLYVAVGENANGSNAQNLDTYHGKILRINADGTIPSDNPFPTGSNQRRSVWALGLRNPYTITFQQGTNKLFINDVGGGGWEEINDATIGGRNFGWPGDEGIETSTSFTNPIYAYPHGSGDGRGCAITGGAFLNSAASNYPSAYRGKYFYMDYCNNWINFIDPTVSSPARNPFATSLPGNSLSITQGPDGNLYFLNRNNRSVYKLIYNATAPIITDQPDNLTVMVGQTASFSVSATGSAPLTYQWTKDNVTIAGANSATYTITNTQTSHAGLYRVVVSNAVGSATSNAASLTVSNNQAPTATIFTPATGTTYKGGDTISFSGDATDPEQGTLPASAFSWSMDFWHGTGGSQHVHSGPPIATGVKSGKYIVPTSGETADDVFYRLLLTVTDASGATNTKSVDIQPRKSTISLATSPTGLQLTLDGQPVTTPFSDVGVEGIQRTIGVVSPQTINGVTYTFSNWQHGGAASQTISTPVNDITYTAVFVASALRDPENPSNTVSGLDYSYYEGAWSVLPDFNSLTPIERGTVPTFDLSPRNREDDYAFRYVGYINVPADGNYTFYTRSDDGSRLYIGSTLVVNNDGLHGAQEASGAIGLKAGKHAVIVTFFEHLGDAVLSVSYSGPGIAKQVIPATSLFKQGTSAFEVKVNFQPSGTVPAGYLADNGAAFGNRGNGFSYGWNVTTNETRLRASTTYDLRYRTLNHMMKPVNPNAVWEIIVDNGTYTVNWVAGDAEHTDQVNNFNLEGTIHNDPDGRDNFDEYTATVTVSDGRLTLRPATGASNAKINFIHITKVSALRMSADVAASKINIYPVPVNNKVTIEVESEKDEIIEINLIDATGISIHNLSRQVSPGTNSFTFDLNNVEAGYYMAVIKQGDRTESRKIVVVK
jgi:glucose/arabinose dehydrogenase